MQLGHIQAIGFDTYRMVQEPRKNTGTIIMFHVERRRLCPPSCSSYALDPSVEGIRRVACLCIALCLDPCLLPCCEGDPSAQVNIHNVVFIHEHICQNVLTSN